MTPKSPPASSDSVGECVAAECCEWCDLTEYPDALPAGLTPCAGGSVALPRLLPGIEDIAAAATGERTCHHPCKDFQPVACEPLPMQRKGIQGIWLLGWCAARTPAEEVDSGEPRFICICAAYPESPSMAATAAALLDKNKLSYCFASASCDRLSDCTIASSAAERCRCASMEAVDSCEAAREQSASEAAAAACSTTVCCSSALDAVSVSLAWRRCAFSARKLSACV